MQNQTMGEWVEPEDLIPLGLVVEDIQGQRFVYIGRRVTRVGTYNRYFHAALGEPHTPTFGYWMYHAVKDETLIARFPELHRYLQKEPA